MKITKLEIEGFGKLINRTVSLGDLTTFLGDNEAGKSTTFAFIKYLLFGFENANQKNRDYYPLKSKTYGGRLFAEHDGDAIMIERVKVLKTGSPSFKAIINDKSLTESEWQQYLSPMTVGLFNDIYSVTQDNLQMDTVKQYNEESLNNQWRITAATGSIALFDTMQELEKSRDGLYTSQRAMTKPVMQKIQQLEQLETALMTRIDEERAVAPMMARAEESKRQVDDLRARVSTLDEELSRVKQQIAHSKDFEEYQDLKSLDGEQLLTESEAAKLQANYSQHQNYERSIALLEEQISDNRSESMAYDNARTHFLTALETEVQMEGIQQAFPEAQQAEAIITHSKVNYLGLILAGFGLLVAVVTFLMNLVLVSALGIVLIIIGIVFFVIQSKRRKQLIAEQQQFIDRFEGQADYFKNWVGLANQTVVEQYQQIMALESEMADLRAIFAKYDYQSLEEKLADLKLTHQSLLQEVPGLSEVPQIIQDWRQKKAQLARKEQLAQQLADIYELNDNFNPEAAQAKANRLMSDRVDAQALLQKLIDENSLNLARIERDSHDTTIEQLQADISREQTNLADLLRQYASLDAEVDLIRHAMNELSTKTLPDILAIASGYLRDLTEGKWQQIFLTKEILHVANEDSQLRLLDLSTGTRDQVQLALRLAFIASKDTSFPLLLDDNFLRYDEKRRQHFAQLLEKLSQTRQVIVFTSDKRFLQEGVVQL